MVEIRDCYYLEGSNLFLMADLAWRGDGMAGMLAFFASVTLVALHSL